MAQQYEEVVFTFYIKNYMSGSSYKRSEAEMFHIPNEESSDNLVIDPRITMEMGKAGSLEFKMEMGHPFYSAMLQMKTIIRVEYFGRTLFRGRVLTIDNAMYGTRTIHCEGDLAFLLDTMMEAVRDELKQKKELKNWITEVLDHHNSWVESDKKIYKGNLPGNYASGIRSEQKIGNDTKKYDQDSWASTLSCLESLSSQYGGYWRTRYDRGTVYLDWMKNYFDRGGDQKIEIGKNLIDISHSLEVNNLFTVVVPVGSRKGKSLYLDPKYVEVPEVVAYYGSGSSELNEIYHSESEYRDAISNYGYIYKSVKFENADDTTKLKQYCMDWIKNNYHGGLSSFDVTAFDLKIVGESQEPLWVGDLVTVIFPDVNGSGGTSQIKYTIIKIEYDLYNPEATKYRIGIPDSSLNKTYGEAKKTSSKSGSVKNPSTAQTGDWLNELLGLENQTDEETNTTRRNMAMFFKTVLYGGSTSDSGSEGDTQSAETSRETDNDSDNIFKYILKPDALKTTLLDGLKGNVTDLLTVGGNASSNKGGTKAGGSAWRTSSPIFLDGKTGDITSRKGSIYCLQIQVGSNPDSSTENVAYINMAGQIGGTSLTIKDGGITVDNNYASTQNSLKIKGNGSVEIDGGNLHVAKGNLDVTLGNIETYSGNIKTYIGNIDAPAGYIAGKTLGGDNVYARQNRTGTDLAASSFCDVAASESNGVITFKFWGPNKTQSDTPVKTVNFNMADTQFFKDQVKAHWNDGGKTAYLSAASATINPGETTTIYAKYVDYDGNVNQDPSNSAGRPISCTVTANAASHSIGITPDTSAYDTQSGVQIFDGVTFESGKWYRFKVKCGDAEKDYTIHI